MPGSMAFEKKWQFLSGNKQIDLNSLGSDEEVLAVLEHLHESGQLGTHEGSSSSEVELFDQATVPLDAPATYLRFERDVDGDVQAIYLGTVD